MNRLGKSDSGSFSRPRNNSLMHLDKSLNSPTTPKSNDMLSESQKSERRILPPREQHIEMIEMKEQLFNNTSTPYKIHNCVCFVAEECLSYNCNCFLSPLPCTPECCPNCINLKSNLPLKVSNVCNCKKTKCLKLYCECLAKGLYCSIMCMCELCQNHSHSKLRKDIQHMIDKEQTYFKGCSCKKISCDKKYCECFSQNMKCTSSCKCVNCNNAQEIVLMDVEQPPEERKRFTVDVPEMAFEAPDLFGENKKKKR